ncbi:hypothetical protein [Brevibacillus brevis]|uniref:hypothetical protein n=1 Tax=Brevibacillus brevis TaxID=1393 RepID=UPI001EDB67A1|nr:hypothetical protein [Brevibacillus brevis]UKK99472.1 hypothetical protein FO446_19460 [Brevibacillus brevis]
MSFKVYRLTDYFQLLTHTAETNKHKLPPPLPWIEPSVNMLYLEAASSFLFGNYYSAIISTSTLLEHTLRVAVLSPDQNGLKRKLSKTKLNKYQSISELLKAPNINQLIPHQDDQDWWDKIGRDLRNKVAHYLIPTLLKRYTTKDYHPEHYVITNDDGSPKGNDLLHDWGSFYHRSDYYISERFLSESYDQLSKLIANTQWQADTSWWISQKDWYDEFFSYDWTHDKMQDSLRTLYTTMNFEDSLSNKE